MATPAETVRDLLTADPQIASTLVGGIYYGREVSRDETPAAFDDYGEVLPCATVRTQTESPTGPVDIAGAAIVSIYLYHPDGFGLLGELVNRIYFMLHRAKPAGLIETRWLYDSPEVYDQVLNCPMRETRYRALRYRG